jgi:hypothetical protein
VFFCALKTFSLLGRVSIWIFNIKYIRIHYDSGRFSVPDLFIRSISFQLFRYTFNFGTFIFNSLFHTKKARYPLHKRETDTALSDSIIILYVLNSKIFLLSAANDGKLSFDHVFFTHHMLKVCYTFTVKVYCTISDIFTRLSLRW